MANPDYLFRADGEQTVGLSKSERSVQKRAVETLFSVLEEMCDGALSVDANPRIVWINEKYRPLLGIAEGEDVLGRDVEEVIPENLMREVVKCGTPMPVDILNIDQHSLVEIRVVDEGNGRSTVEWTSGFDSEAGHEFTSVRAFQKLYQNALDNLQSLVFGK